MPHRTNPALSGELEHLFELALNVTDAHPWPTEIIIQHGTTSYYFDKHGNCGLFQGNSSLMLNKIAGTLYHHPAQAGGFWEAQDARDTESSPYFFQVSDNSSLEVAIASAISTDHTLGFSLVRTDGKAIPTVTSATHYPSWWQAPSRAFFQNRGITSGMFHCNSLKEAALEVVLRPDSFESVDFEGSDTYSKNQLVFDAGLQAFVMNFTVTQSLREDTEILVEQLSRVQNFLFQDLRSWLSQQELPFGTYLAERLSISDAGRFSERLDCFEPLDSSGRLGSYYECWFEPDALRVTVMTPSVDPSFGTVTDSSWSRSELFEFKENWIRTDFEKVNARAYLNRLATQAKQHPAPKSNY